MQTAIETIQVHENYAVSEAGKLASNQTLSDNYKKDEIRRLTSEALSAVDATADGALKGIETEIASLRSQSRRPFAPPREDIAALTYTRDLLQAKVAYLSEPDLYDMWQEAIDQGETITARVFEDFGEAIIRQTEAYTRENGIHKGAALPHRYNDLRQKTDDLLATPAQKEARAKVETLTKSLLEIEQARSLARQRLAAMKVNGKGGLISGDDALRKASFERQRRGVS